MLQNNQEVKMNKDLMLTNILTASSFASLNEPQTQGQATLKEGQKLLYVLEYGVGVKRNGQEQFR